MPYLGQYWIDFGVDTYPTPGNIVGNARQKALTGAIQEGLAKVAPKDDGPSPNDAQREQMARARRAKQNKAKVVAIDAKETAA